MKSSFVISSRSCSASLEDHNDMGSVNTNHDQREQHATYVNSKVKSSFVISSRSCSASLKDRDYDYHKDMDSVSTNHERQEQHATLVNSKVKSSFVIASRSSSSSLGDHDYTYHNDMDSVSRNNERLEQNATQPDAHNMMSLADQASPTSVYTTETNNNDESPVDERTNCEQQEEAKKKGSTSQKAQYVGSMTNNSKNAKNRASIFRCKKNFHSNQGANSCAAISVTDKTIRAPICSWWTWFTEDILHANLVRFVVWLSGIAARYPYTTIAVTAVASVGILAIGFLTNFNLIVDTDQIFTPLNSKSVEHYEWLLDESGFNNIRPLILLVHAQGANVLGKRSLERLFDAIDTVRNTPGYDDLCKQGSFVSYDNIHTCRVLSATRFWNHNRTLFEQDITTDAKAAYVLSQQLYPNSQTPVFHEMILGNYEMATTTLEYRAASPGTNQPMTITAQSEQHPKLHFVQSLFVRFELPDVPDADEFETRALERLEVLKQQWHDENQQFEQDLVPVSLMDTSETTTMNYTTQQNGTHNLHSQPMDDVESQQHLPLQLDFLSIFAYKIENQRALMRDLPLILVIFLVLIIFTTLVFTKPHPVFSRSMLGSASLITIGMSLCFSYGLVWCIGIPFTNLAQILPFMIMGVGLDDTFIITGEYFRTNPNVNIEQRIAVTMKEVGLSISITSITTMVAFLLGSFSAIPGVKWLCYYALSAIVCDYLFQISVFVSFLVLDERRLQAYRRNFCCWKRVPVDVDEFESQMGVIINSSLEDKSDNSTANDDDDIVINVSHNADEEQSVVVVAPRHIRTKMSTPTTPNSNDHFSERFMLWYGRQLMRPLVKLLVLIVFAAYFGFCCYRTTLLTQEFNVEDYTPSDSYLRGTLHSLDTYYSLTKPIEVFFRFVDQSDENIQEQMRNYVNELAALPQIGEKATFCWAHDFPTLEERFPEYAFIQNFTFTQKVRLALANPTIREVYGEDIVVDEDTGEITASRCLLFLRNVDLSVVQDQIDMLLGQRLVSMNQPINQDQDDWPFFSFDPIFFFWELYAQAVNELLVTIVTGVVSVTLVTFLLIPHWSAVFFVCPGIIILYIDFLGTMQWMGLHINSLTYVIICMAIGLLVDSLVHIILKYYETNSPSRDAKVIETLRTMGASMFVGGTTTFLSVCPLVFSTTHIFMTVFYSFAAIVLLGFTHGLILLPVVLSLVGPVATHRLKEEPGTVISIQGAVSQLEKGKDKDESMSSTSSDSVSSNKASKFDDEILESSTEEELEELKSDLSKESPDNKKRGIPFLGPAYDLEAIEEGPDSTRNRPDSTKSTQSRWSIVPAPSDEITLLGQLVTDTCGADFGFNEVFNSVHLCKTPKR